MFPLFVRLESLFYLIPLTQSALSSHFLIFRCCSLFISALFLFHFRPACPIVCLLSFISCLFSHQFYCLLCVIFLPLYHSCRHLCFLRISMSRPCLLLPVSGFMFTSRHHISCSRYLHLPRKQIELCFFLFFITET